MGGLIEAISRAISSIAAMPFPRSIDRGLIEAMISTTRSGVHSSFPRSIDRGL
jgi:hypothetical protein